MWRPLRDFTFADLVPGDHLLSPTNKIGKITRINAKDSSLEVEWRAGGEPGNWADSWNYYWWFLHEEPLKIWRPNHDEVVEL